MPNPGKPTSLKLISGSRRVCKSGVSRLADDTHVMPSLATVPQAPPWLPNAHARCEWDRLTPLLVANRLLTEAGLTVLAHACALHGSIVQAMAAGQQPKAATVSVYRQLINDFGLTPAAQTKVPARAGGAGANPFSRHGCRGA